MNDDTKLQNTITEATPTWFWSTH